MCTAAVAHPAGLLYTAHEHWDDVKQECRNIVHVWDLRPRLPERLHSFFPTDRVSSPDCCMHLDGGFLALAGQLAGRPQIRHALRPPGQPGMVVQSKIRGGLHINEDDRMATAIHVRSASRDVFIGYAQGKVAHHDLESGICLTDMHGAAKNVTALAGHGEQVFACGRGHDEHACVTTLSTRDHELFGKRLHPLGAFMQPPNHDMGKLLNFADGTAEMALVETTVQANAMLVDGQRLLAAANDVIFVWEGLTEPQDVPPTLAHTLELQHLRRGGRRAVDGASQLAVARERDLLFVAINGAEANLAPTARFIGPKRTECTVQVWHLPPPDSERAPACLHKLPAGFEGSITAMLLVDARLLTWGSDRTLRVWPIDTLRETTAAEVAAAARNEPAGPAPWEVGGGAQHPSVEDGRGMLDGEEPWVWEPESDDESEGSVHGSEEDEEGEEEDEEGEEEDEEGADE